MKNYIFKQVRYEPYPPDLMLPIIMANTPFIVWRHRSTLRPFLGRSEFYKLLIKSLFHNRVFYFFLNGKVLMACGYLNIGFCRHYEVEPTNVVIGSIWTTPIYRGKGIATKGIQTAINWTMGKGYHTFYIDTQETNTPMLKSIEKLGFGEPINEFDS